MAEAATVKKPKMKSKEYPAVSFNKALEFVEKFKDFGNKPIAYDVAAKLCNVTKTTKSFAYTRSAAKQFGLITISGQALTLTETANRLIRPTEGAAVLARLKTECFSSPTLYKALIKDYNGVSLPEIISLENILVSHHGIAPSVAKSAAQTFLESAQEVGVAVHGVLNMDAADELGTDAPANENTGNDVPDVDSLPTMTALPPADNSEEFGAPLTISFGDKRRAILYMPIDTTQEDAEYVRDMINLMFKKVYKVGSNGTKEQ